MLGPIVVQLFVPGDGAIIASGTTDGEARDEGVSVRLGENRATLITDRLKDRLDGKPAASERAYIDSTGRATPPPV